VPDKPPSQPPKEALADLADAWRASGFRPAEGLLAFHLETRSRRFEERSPARGEHTVKRAAVMAPCSRTHFALRPSDCLGSFSGGMQAGSCVVGRDLRV
jgi:hypothetical protein